MSHSYSSSSYTSYSSSSTSADGRVTGSTHKEESIANPSGASVRTTTQNLGEPVIQETRHYDAEGREVPTQRLTGTTGSNTARRIEEVSDDAAAQYQDRIEDEYAKREGGA